MQRTVIQQHCVRKLSSDRQLSVSFNLMCTLYREEVNALAKKLRLKLFRSSVKEMFNVEEGKWSPQYSPLQPL